MADGLLSIDQAGHASDEAEVQTRAVELAEDRNDDLPEAENPYGVYRAEIISYSTIFRLPSTGSEPEMFLGGLGPVDTKTDGVYPRLITTIDKYHLSGISLEFLVKYSIDDHQVSKRLEWHLTHLNMRSRTGLTMLPADAEIFRTSRRGNDLANSEALRTDWQLSSDQSIDTAVEVFFEKPETVYAVGIFSAQEEFGSQSTTYRRICEVLRSGPFKVLASSETLLDNLECTRDSVVSQWKNPYPAKFFEAYGVANPMGEGDNKMRTTESNPPFPKDYTWRRAVTSADFLDYRTKNTLAFELEVWAERCMRTVYKGVNARFMINPNTHARFWAILDLPSYGRPKFIEGSLNDEGHLEVVRDAFAMASDKLGEMVRMRDGDSIMLNPNPNGDNPRDCFHGVITSQLAIAGLGFACAIMKSHVNEDTGKFIEPTHLSRMDPNTIPDIEIAKRFLSETTPTTVNVSVNVGSHPTILRHQAWAAFQTLIWSDEIFRERKARPLLGNNMSSFPLVNLLGEFWGTEQEVAAYLNHFSKNFSLEQQDAWKLVQACHAGLCIVDGAAGSGKSFLTQRVALAHIGRSQPDKMRNKSLVVAPRNDAADHYAQSLNLMLLALPRSGVLDRPRDNYKIVRAFSPKTELAVFLAPYLAQRPLGSQKIEEIFAHSSWDANLATTVAKYVATKFQCHSKRHLPHISNPRVRSTEMTLGEYMRKKLGKLQKKYGVLSSIISKIKRGRELTKDESSTMKGHIFELMNDSIDDIDVLVVTVTQALEPRYYRKYKPTLTVLEESSQLTEVEYAGLLGRWPTSRGTLISGDRPQAPPFSMSTPGTNPFLRQYQLSIQERLLLAGATQMVFRNNRRCTKDIADAVSDVYYNGFNINNPETANRTRAVKVRDFNINHFGIANNIVIIDVPGTTQMRLPDTSKYNEGTAGVTAELLSMLAKRFNPSEIGVVSPYSHQQTLHRRLIDNLSNADLRFEHISPHTTVSCQGREFEIVIFDTTINSKPGCLQTDWHSLVAISRGKSGLFIVADLDKIKLMKRDIFIESGFGKLISYCIKQHVVFRWSGGQIAERFLDDVRDISSGDAQPVPEDVSGNRCLQCNQVGHRAKDCPNPKCRNCGQEGHVVADCRNPPCSRCGAVDHNRHNCQEPRPALECYNCGGPHLERACTNKPRPAGQKHGATKPKQPKRNRPCDQSDVPLKR